MSQATLRVIAGELKGRRLVGPDWDGLRPTSDRLRETLFNVLAPYVAEARVLDGFAGTGAIGIEALSRGAAHVTFVDRDPRALALVAGNLARCGVEGRYTVLRADLVAGDRLPLSETFDIVILDPPYAVEPGAAMAHVSRLLASEGRLVLEHARRIVPPDASDGLVRTRTIASGDSALSIYRLEPKASEPVNL